MSGRQGWPNGYYQPGVGVQDVNGAVYAARQQKRSQQQAVLYQGQEQNANWFKDKPANKSARLDIVTHHQQGVVTGAGGGQQVQQHGTAQAGGSSVSIELMAKMKRQKEAKKQAEMQKELAEKRRREALLAVEKADEEYRRACEAERQATEAASGSTASAVNPPPPPPDSEEPAQPAEPSTTEQKAASAAKSALDVSQDEILLSWLNHGDNLKQQWAIWYMHNPEEWNEYKTSHQKQTGGTTATTTNANASTTTSAAPDTATAGAAADASKTAAAAAAQQNTYSQPNAQADTGATEAQPGAASNSAAAQSSTDAAAAAAGAQHMSAAYPRPPPHGQAWPGWPGWPPGTPYGAVPYAQYPGPTPYPNYYGVPPFAGGPMMPYGQRPPQNYPYPRMPGPQGPMHPMYGGPGNPPANPPGAPGAYPPQAGAAAPHASGARPRPPAGAPASKRRSHSPGATQPQLQPQISPNGGNSGGASAARNANASAGASPGPSGHALKKPQEQQSAAAGSSRPPESQQQHAYATQPSQAAANAQSQQSQHAEHAHPHPPRQQQQQSQQPQYMQQQQSVAPGPPAAPPSQQAQPPQDCHPYQQYPSQPPQPPTQSDSRGEPQYTAQPPQPSQHSQHSHVQQPQSAPAHQATQMHDSQQQQQQQQRPMQQGQHGGPASAAPPSAAAAASQWPGAHGVRGVRGVPAQAAHGYPQPGDDVVSRSGGATESSQGVQASVQRGEQVSGGSQPQQYAAAATAADEQSFSQWAQQQQQQQQSAPMPPAQAAGSSQHGYPHRAPHNSSTHARTSGTPPGSQDASRPQQLRQGLYSSQKAPAAHSDRMQEQNHTHNHNQQLQQQQPVPGQQQQHQTSFPMQQHQQQPYAVQQQYARQDQQERPPTSFPTSDDGQAPNPPSHPPESRSAGYSNPGPSGHYQQHSGPPLSHQQHSATAPSIDSYVSHSSYEKAPHSGHDGNNNRGPPTWHPDAQPSMQPNSDSPPHPPQPPQPPSAGPCGQEAYHQPSGSKTVGSARHSAGGSQMSQDPNHVQHQGSTQYWQQSDSFNRGVDQSMPVQGHESGMGGPPWGSREPHAHGGAPHGGGASAPSVPLYHRQGQGQVQQQQHQQQGQVQGVPQGHEEPSGGMRMDAPTRTSPQYSQHPEPTSNNNSAFGSQSSKAAGGAAQFSAEDPASQHTEGTKYQHTPANDMLMSGGGGSGGGSMWGQNPQDQNSQAPQCPVQGQLQSQAAGQAAAAAAQGMASTHEPLQAHQAHQVQAQNQHPNAPPAWQQPQPPTAGPKPGYVHMQRAASSPGGVRQSGAPHAQAAPWLKAADQSQSFSQNNRSEAGDARTHTGAGAHSQTAQPVQPPMQRGAGGEVGAGVGVSKERESSRMQPGPRKGYLATRSNSAPRNASDTGGFLRNNSNNTSNRSQSADGRISNANAPNTRAQVASQQRANGTTMDRDRAPPPGPPSQSKGLYASKNTSSQQGANDLMASGVPGLSHRGNSGDRGTAMSGAMSANTLNAGSLPASLPAPPTGGASSSASLASMQTPRPLPPSLPAFVSSAEARPGGAMSASLGGSSSWAAAQQLPLPRLSGASEVAVLPANIGASIGGASIGTHQPSPPPGPPGAEQDTASTPSWLVSSEPQAELDKQQQLPLGTLPKVSSLPPPNSSTQHTQHPTHPQINSFQHSWKPQSQTPQPQPPQGRDTSNTAAPSNANPAASASSLPRPMPRSGGSSASTPLPPPGSAGYIGSIPPVHMSAASHSKPSPSPPQADASAPLPPPGVTSGVNSGVNSVLPSPSSINPSPPSSARVDGSNTALPQEPAGGAKPRPGPRYDTHGMGMAPYMQQGVRGGSSGSSSGALPGGKPPQNAAPDAAVPAGLPGPGNMQQNSNQPPGMQGMSQMPSQGNVPNMRMLSHQRDAGAVPAAPPGIHTVSQRIPGNLPASRPSIVNGKQGGVPVPAGSGSGGMMITTRIESGCSAMGAQVIQAGPQQQQQQKFAAVPMPGPGPRGGALPPAQSQGAVKQGGFISRRSPSASGPMVANPHPPAVQIVRAAQPVQAAQNGMQVLPGVPVGGPMSQIRPAPPRPSPRGVHMQTVALQPWAQGAGRPQGQVAPNEMTLFRGPAPVRPQIGAVPMMRPPGYR